MERRIFLTAMLGVAGAFATSALPGAEAMALPVDRASDAPRPIGSEAAVATPEDLEQARTENVWYYWRRRRFYRRYYYRPRYYVRRRYYRRWWF